MQPKPRPSAANLEQACQKSAVLPCPAIAAVGRSLERFAHFEQAGSWVFAWAPTIAGFHPHRVHPLPHGCQRHALLQILKLWHWDAKPLQPDKGTAQGSAWIVGAGEEPSAAALPLDAGHVLVTKLPSGSAPHAKPGALYASAQTLRRIRQDDEATDMPADPWAGGQDPWSAAKLAKDLPPPPGLSLSRPVNTPAVSKLEQIGAELKQDLKGLVQTELANLPASNGSQSQQEDRLRKLEVGVAEIRQQNTKFETWFSEFGKKVATQGQELGNLSQSVQQQSQAFTRLQSEVEATMSGAVGKLQSDMTAQLQGQFEQLQSLLADKKSRTA